MALGRWVRETGRREYSPAVRPGQTIPGSGQETDGVHVPEWLPIRSSGCVRPVHEITGTRDFTAAEALCLEALDGGGG